MDKFIVSARKYRPQLFNTVVGQAHITTTLKNAIKHNQLAHAFLFCGPRGVGKTTCARILAKTINCENQTKEGEACNTCQSCTSFNDGASMNIHELDAASNNSVDDIRTLVEQVRFAPQAGKYKVYIIDEVHMLSSSAFNAFLKTLEEPPSYAIFILATTEKHKILPTILSRCQIFDFKRITTNDTVEHLQEICDKEEIKADKASLQVIAQKSEGCMRDALSILDKIVSFTNGEVVYANTLEHLNILDADYYFKLMGCMQQQDLSGAMLLFDDINRKGFEGDLVVNGFAEFIRNLLVSKDEKCAGLLDVVESFRDKYIAAAKKINTAYLISALNILNETEINYKAARNKRLHVELALIKLCYLHQAIELTNSEGGLSKKKLIERPVAFRTTAIKQFIPQSAQTTPLPATKPKEAKLIIETPREDAYVVREEKENYKKKQPGANAKEVVIEQSAGVAVLSGTKTVAAPTAKLASLEKLRKQIKGDTNAAGESINHPVKIDELQKAWDDYVVKLKEEKNPAAQNFEMAELKLQDENSFIAMVSNNIQFRFLEQEGQRASEYLKEKLGNNLLQFFIVMQENKEIKEDVNAPLNSRQQYQLLVEKYPLIKELKERLKLDLDY
jgi:DNA polymerase III subunit gamma/tau